jgi:adenylate cyclase
MPAITPWQSIMPTEPCASARSISTPCLFSFARGASHFHLRQLPEAVVWLSKAVQQNPRFTSSYVSLGSALAHAGRMEEARTAIRRLLVLHPADSTTWRRQRRLLSREADFERLMEGARLAGLPE